jgi:hypothetical protein
MGLIMPTSNTSEQCEYFKSFVAPNNLVCGYRCKLEKGHTGNHIGGSGLPPPGYMPTDDDLVAGTGETAWA